MINNFEYHITQEMEVNFLERLDLHRKLVQNNLILMTGYLNISADILSDLAQQHDMSKFDAPERTAYLWITWSYQNDKKFSFPDFIKNQVEQGWLHHIQNNRHHPEAHQNINKMSEIDIIEMVCDWTAIAQENYGINSSCKEWAEQNIDQKWCFSSAMKKQIFSTILALNERRGIL